MRGNIPAVVQGQNNRLEGIKKISAYLLIFGLQVVGNYAVTSLKESNPAAAKVLDPVLKLAGLLAMGILIWRSLEENHGRRQVPGPFQANQLNRGNAAEPEHPHVV